MDVFEITGYQTGVSKAGVNYLMPSDSFENMEDGFIYRQVLQSRKGISRFCNRLTNGTRVMGIFEFNLEDGSIKLLAFDTNHAYLYNTITGNFDQLTFGGSLLLIGYTGFDLQNNDDYISGTSYPDKDKNSRFVFTSKGMRLDTTASGILFYDNASNTIKDYCNAALDNPDFKDPPGLLNDLQRARYVTAFNLRINFFYPEISGQQYPHNLLHSATTDNSATPEVQDKFNVPGAGFPPFDTYQYITGQEILGNDIIVLFNRSSYSLSKTTDVFNAYFPRRIPGVLGTDGLFSSVSWNDTVKSLGKTGVIGTDARQSLRIDNKIPTFTADRISQNKFSEIYGGFDRINNQFLWTYTDSETEFETQDRILVNSYEFDTWAVYNLRLTCFGQTTLGLDLTWDQIDETTGNASWAMWDTTEEIWDKIGLGGEVQKTLAGDNLGFIYDINTDYDDYYTAISDISQASQAVLTVSESAFLAGDLVVVQDVEDMTQINNYDPEIDPSTFTAYTVLAATTTSITLDVDSTNFTPYIIGVSGGSLSKIISFSAETIPFNPYRSIGRRVFISHVEFLLDTDNGYIKVDVFEDGEDSPFKADVLIRPTSTQKNREWITLIVDNESNFFRLRMKQASPATQVKITSIRIHASPGGMTSG